jgi:hypothetical protein
MLKLSFVVWIVMGHIGGASPAFSNHTLCTLFIVLNNGKMALSKMLHYVTWDMFSCLAIPPQVVAAPEMATYSEIEG